LGSSVGDFDGRLQAVRINITTKLKNRIVRMNFSI
jgi:hypothetical protein